MEEEIGYYSINQLMEEDGYGYRKYPSQRSS
jgi:hypothetical protein